MTLERRMLACTQRLLSFLLVLIASALPSASQPNSENSHHLTADPVEARAGGGWGRTRLSWRTADARPASLYAVIQEDGSLVHMADGSSGVADVDWIFPGKTQEFRLYAAGSTDAPLGSVTVIGGSEVDFSPPLGRIFSAVRKRGGVILTILLLLLATSFFAASRPRFAKLDRRVLAAAALLVLIIATGILNRSTLPALEKQPAPDAQETADAARRIASGAGYVTFYHGGEARPPRYPPGFSIVLSPFASFGEYPSNILFGSRVFACLCLWAAMFAAWRFGGELAAILTGFFIAVSPFLDKYAGLVLSEAFTAALVVAIAVLIRKPSLWRVLAAGAIAGFLITVRLQMIVCLPALLLALPTMRQRVIAASSSSPFLAANGIYNWITFGSPFKTGYDYWLPHIRPFGLDYTVTLFSENNSGMISDVMQGWLMRWVCPCGMDGPLAALPNIIFYPLVLVGAFWMFAPPLVTGYGLFCVWKRRRADAAAKFTLWLIAFSLPLFSFYFFQASRFMAAIAMLLIVFAAAGLAAKWQAFTQSRGLPNS